MRRCEDIFRYQKRNLSNAIRAPELFQPELKGLEALYHEMIMSLSFIDERIGEDTGLLEAPHISLLSEWGLWTNLGVTGGFMQLYSTSGSLDFKEIALIFALVSYQLGYIELDRQPMSIQWEACSHFVADSLLEEDWCVSSVQHLLGEPSYYSGNKRSSCSLYLSASLDKVFFFSYRSEFVRDEGEVHGYYREDPRLSHVIALEAQSHSVELFWTRLGALKSVSPG